MRELKQTGSTGGETAISFAQKVVTSGGFKLLFKEGMLLVEETATYLDGDGRADSKDVPRIVALTYASESMRLTTRLMQMTSWLLLQRAVNEGEITREEAAAEHRKVKIRTNDVLTSSEAIELLPARLKDLIARSLRLQDRLLKLDAVLAGDENFSAPDVNPVEAQLAGLKAALGLKRS